ncbi:MAG: sulfatase-like hydrolase/transferase [Saprospiraceae bacterium]|nr:sulfatase-like hydrolase/transferase [Saprospiraceae bacterium]
MNSILVRISALFSLLLLLSCNGNNRQTSESQLLPNIVLLMGDDHGWDEVGYNGHPHIKTPVLDEMAARGLRLDRFYSAHPTCSPTRGSFLTGRHPNRYGTFAPNWSIRPEEISIAHILKKAGYATAHFGKWHLGPVKSDSPTNPGAMGFDEWLSHDNFFEMNPVLSRNGATPERLEGEGSQVIIDEALDFIRRAKQKNQPYFVIVWFGSPHEPYSGLEEDLALYDNLPDAYSSQRVTLTSNESGEAIERPLNEVLRERYAEITAMDRSIGVLRNFLRDEGLRDNTLVWYCGDNGTPPSAARTGMTLRGEKGTMYEGGIRVPAVIEWPAGILSSVSTLPSVTTDVLPTLCDLTNQPLPDRPLDGISLAAAFTGNLDTRPSPLCFWSFESDIFFNNNAKPYIDPRLQEGTTPLVKVMDGKYTRSFRNYVYPEISENDFGGARSIIGPHYKVVIDQSQDEPIELFDLESDPGEKMNLSTEKPEVVDTMQKQLYDWQKSVLTSLTGRDYR